MTIRFAGMGDVPPAGRLYSGGATSVSMNPAPIGNSEVKEEKPQRGEHSPHHQPIDWYMLRCVKGGDVKTKRSKTMALTLAVARTRIALLAAAIAVAGLPGSAAAMAIKWHPKVQLTNTVVASQWPDVAAAKGAVHVVWLTDGSKDGRDRIFYMRSPDGGATWEEPVRLARRIDAGPPSIAVAGNTVHVAWTEEAKWVNNEMITPDLVRYRASYNGGDSWEPRKRLSSGDPGFRYGVEIAAWGQSVQVAWADASGDTWRIWHRRSLDGGQTWLKRKQISHTGRSDYDFSPDIAVRGSHVYVVWWIGGSGGVAYSGSHDYGKTFSHPITIGFRPYAWSAPAITAAKSAVVVAWTEWVDDVAWRVVQRRSTDHGETWADRVPVSDEVDRYAAPAIASSRDRVHAVWTAELEGRRITQYVRSTDSGATWTSVWRKPGGSAVAASGPTVHMVWNKKVSGTWQIFYVRRA